MFISSLLASEHFTIQSQGEKKMLIIGIKRFVYYKKVSNLNSIPRTEKSVSVTSSAAEAL